MIKNLTQFIKESILGNVEDTVSLDNAYEAYKVNKSNFTKTSSTTGVVISQCKELIQHVLQSGVYTLHTPSDINKITGIGAQVFVNKGSHRNGYLAFF